MMSVIMTGSWDDSFRQLPYKKFSFFFSEQRDWAIQGITSRTNLPRKHEHICIGEKENIEALVFTFFNNKSNPNNQCAVPTVYCAVHVGCIVCNWSSYHHYIYLFICLFFPKHNYTIFMTYHNIPPPNIFIMDVQYVHFKCRLNSFSILVLVAVFTVLLYYQYEADIFNFLHRMQYIFIYID